MPVADSGGAVKLKQCKDEHVLEASKVTVAAISHELWRSSSVNYERTALVE